MFDVLLFVVGVMWLCVVNYLCGLRYVCFYDGVFVICVACFGVVN